MGLIFRRCELTDLDALVKISKDTFVSAFEKENNPSDFQAYIKKAFSPKRLQKELKNPDSLFYFVFDMGKTLVGYFKINIGDAQTDVFDVKSMELERIYVTQAYQGQKIGAQILQKAVQLGRELHKDYIWLGVWEHNPMAIKFYKRHGFQKIGEHPYAIGKDVQNDWLLKLKL